MHDATRRQMLALLGIENLRARKRRRDEQHLVLFREQRHHLMAALPQIVPVIQRK